MDFVVDKVSEDSFYINILTGLPRQLDKFKKLGITSRHLIRKPPVPHSEICLWEQKQSILLPEDLRNFYNSCNGFLFTWRFSFGAQKEETNEIIGKIHVNELENLIPFTDYECVNNPGVNTNQERFELRPGASSRLFELQTLDENSKVVLVYLNSRYSPTIWVTANQKFYFLSDDFTTYFRMSLAHIGIPNWQLLFTPKSVPQWTQNMIRLLVPHLINTNQWVESARKQRCQSIADDHVDAPVNDLDTAIFKCLPRASHGVPRVVEKEKCDLTKKSKRESKTDKDAVLTREKSFTMMKPTLFRRKLH